MAHCTSLCLFFLVSRDAQSQYHHHRVESDGQGGDGVDAFSLLALSSSYLQNHGTEMNATEQ